MKRTRVYFGLLILAFAFSANRAVAAGNSTEAQKLDFDGVVVQTLDRAPTKLDTVGIIDRKGKGKALYRKKTIFREEISQTLKEAETAW